MTQSPINDTPASVHYRKGVSTWVVYSDAKNGDGYVGDLWHDDDTATLVHRECWCINDGSHYLWGYDSPESAVNALLEAQA